MSALLLKSSNASTLPMTIPRSGSVLSLEGSALQFMARTRFHFDSLAHDNSAQASAIDSVVVIPNARSDKTPPAIMLSGVQSVAKFNKVDQDQVRILMALFRVEDKRVDLVVTFNVPTESQDHADGAIDEEGWNLVQIHFDAFIRSLCIVDFSLFVSSTAI
jgi:hypothetical protein